jgi:hypothetical protein
VSFHLTLRVQLRELANARRRFGYRRLFVLLRQHGEPSGLNRIYRFYREEGLSVNKRWARRRAVGTRAPVLVEARPNARWSLDFGFVHDQFANGRRFQILPVGETEDPAAIADLDLIERHVERVQLPRPAIALAWTAPSFAAVKGIVQVPSAKPAMKLDATLCSPPSSRPGDGRRHPARANRGADRRQLDPRFSRGSAQQRLPTSRTRPLKDACKEMAGESEPMSVPTKRKPIK